MTRILIATTEPVLAAGLEAILKSGGLDTFEICRDIAEILSTARQFRPDIAILETSVFPWLGAIDELRKAAPHCQIILWPRNLSQQQAAEAMRLGARGVLPTTVTPAELIEAVDMLASFPPPPRTPGVVVKNLCDPIERQIVKLVGCGMRNNEIASAMRYDESLVTRVVKRVSRRLDVHDRYELALYGLSTANEMLLPQTGEMEPWKKEIETA